MLLNGLAARRYGVILWLAAFGVLWTVVPLVSNAGLPIDVVEIVAWGREWLAGLYRHPPMKTWLMEIAFQASGRWPESAYVLSVLAFAVAQLALYLAVRDVRPRGVAFAVVALSPLIVYFGVHLPQWNANIAQLPFAALFVLGVWRALDRGRSGWWLLAGAAAAGGVLSKYSFALIPVCVAALALYDPWMRSRIRPLGAALGVLAAVVLLVPHLLWVLDNFDAAQSGVTGHGRMHLGGWTDRLTAPLSVIGVTLAVAILPAIAIRFGTEGRGGAAADTVRAGKLKSLFGAALIGPVLIVAAIAAATGVMIKDHWLIVHFLFLPGWLLLAMRRGDADLAWTPRGNAFVLACVAVLALVYPVERLSHYWFADGRPVAWAPLMPAAPLADAARATWRDALAAAELPADTPIPVAGGTAAAAVVGNVLPERPSWFELLDPAKSPWVDRDMLRRHGLLVIGMAGAERLDGLGLCALAGRDYMWPNGRGGEGATVRIEAFLPAPAGGCKTGR